MGEPIMDKSLIDNYEQGSAKLRKAVAGLSAADAQAFPVPGTWSIQQIVIHLADSDLINSDRMKRIIAEDNPTLIGYDESKFTKNLHYHDQSIEDALTLFEINRRQTARILRKLPDSAFERKGTHNEAGEMNLAQWIQRTVNHLDHHLKFIVEKRAKLAK
jgi:uncharacterized damage-inducible protein DinB